MLKIRGKEITRKEVFHNIWKIFLVFFGTLVLSFGTASFLVPFGIVTGGVSGIGILFQNGGILTADIWSYIICWSLFVIGLLVLGFKFSFQTLISTILYPVFLTIILRTGIGFEIVKLLDGNPAIVDGVVIAQNTSMQIGQLLIIGLFGGALTGIGCGITFIGGGSTGGLDIIAFIVNKFTGINVSITTFVMDATIVATSLIITVASGASYQQFYAGLVGIVSAIVCSVMIEFIYNGISSSLICDAITEKPEELTEYVQKNLQRTTTIFTVVGGYSNEEKTLVRIVISRREYMKLKDAIARIDHTAFVSFHSALKVTGEGFAKNVNSKELPSSKLFKKSKKGKK